MVQLYARAFRYPPRALVWRLTRTADRDLRADTRGGMLVRDGGRERFQTGNVSCLSQLQASDVAMHFFETSGRHFR